ncbi:MAG: hypothetical protein V4469_00770 [Patescibacteria group bacterium]
MRLKQLQKIIKEILRNLKTELFTRKLFTDGIKKFFKKIAGVILIFFGLFGALIPIPLVPFFLLSIAGLKLVGIKKDELDKIKGDIQILVKKK